MSEWSVKHPAGATKEITLKAAENCRNNPAGDWLGNHPTALAEREK